MKIYIAGKITGDPDYRTKFADAQRQIEAQGHIVLNPATLPEGMEPKDYMRICFAMIDVADRVLFLRDWFLSTGAQIEMSYATTSGKSTFWRQLRNGFNAGKRRIIMKIEFYIPSDEFIPSTLRLKVDDEIDVYYEKLQTDFGYRFTFFKFQQGVSRETATEIVNQIVARMVSQSYDHGSQWRENSVRLTLRTTTN